jgi:hypothetical protein
MSRIEVGQLRQWRTTGKFLLVIRKVPESSTWMVLKHTGDIDHYSDSTLEFTTWTIDD